MQGGRVEGTARWDRERRGETEPSREGREGVHAETEGVRVATRCTSHPSVTRGSCGGGGPG